jgi:aromatic ring-cleaving dioxygenase
MADALDALSAGHRALFERAREVCDADERVRALWLSGSVARGDADAASDVDLIVAVRDDAVDDFALGWRAWLARITPTVIARPLPFLPGSFYSVTPGRERLDVVVEPVGKLGATFFRTRRLVFDRDDLHARIPAPAPAQGPSGERIAFLIEEFFRDYGMADVVVTRRDLLLGHEAIHLIRGLLYQLFCEANAPLPPSGVKQWSAKLDADQRALLERLPTGGSTFETMVAAQDAVARAFIDSAREIATANGVTWPEELEEVTLRHVRAHRPSAVSSSPGSVATILSYHAHVYFDPATERAEAEALRDRIAERFRVKLGRWHEVPVGPHTRAMYQVAFTPEVFGRIVPWLMINRGPLTVLVHPNTLAPLDDHVRHALWLGEKLPLVESFLPPRIDAADESPIVPDTTPTLEP